MKTRYLWLLVILITCLIMPGPAVSQPAGLQFGIHTIRADDTALRLARDAGFSWIVQLLEWREVAPAPDRRLWEYPDLLVQGCEYYGLNLALRLDHPPVWAQSTATDSLPVNLEAYTAFVQEVAHRYHGRVQAYVIWNEPNLSIEWNNQPPDPAGYVKLLKAAYSAIKDTDPQAMVVSAGLASTNEQSARALDDRLYLQAMYDHGARGYFDVLGAHPYGFAYPPDDPPGTHESLNFARLSEIRQIMIQNGDGETPVWATEVGWITTPAPESKVWQQVTSQQQADYLIGAFDFAMNHWPWLQLLTVWNLSDSPERLDTTGYSITGEGYTPHPAYQALFNMSKPPQSYRAAEPTAIPHVILAPDVVVHLSDSSHVNPGWSPLYCETAPCRRWTGHFFLSTLAGYAQDVRSTDRIEPEVRPDEFPGISEIPSVLRLEIMQVEEQGNLVRINGQPLHPQAIPLRARPDFATAWTTADMLIPAATLKDGLNTIEIMASPRLIPYQTGIRFESLQVRNIRIIAADTSITDPS